MAANVILDEPEPTAVLDVSSSPLWRLDRVLEYTSIARATLYRMIHAGTFPEAVQLTDRLVAWRAADVIAWARSRPRAAGVEPAELANARRRGRPRKARP